MCFRGLFRRLLEGWDFSNTSKIAEIVSLTLLCAKRRGPWKKGAVYSGEDFLGTCPNSVFKVSTELKSLRSVGLSIEPGLKG